MQLVAPQKAVQKAHFTVRHHFSKFVTLSLFGIALRIAFQQHQNVPIVILDTLDSEKKFKILYSVVFSVSASFCGSQKPKKVLKVEQKETSHIFNYEKRIGDIRFK